MSDAEIFGTTPAGEPVHRVALAAGGLRAWVVTWGAVVQDLRLAGHHAPLVLGFESFDPYPDHSPYLGAVVGRYANRIRDGKFTIDGERYQADRNFLGKHMLHGGRDGFGSRVWTIEASGADHVTLGLTDEGADPGFPGTLRARCTYRLRPGGVLEVELTAETESATLCNLAHHSYFNLDDGGAGTILDHRLMLPAQAYLPVDGEMIPTGVVQPVEGTPFDFRLARTIRFGDETIRYDHNYCLSSQRGPLRLAAWAQGASSGVEMEVWSTEPGIQFYAGDQLAPEPAGLGGRRYQAHSGFCLEPQAWPDSPNHPYFPQALLRPGETYRQTTEYRFRLDAE